MRVMLKIIATICVLGMALGLFTEADLTHGTVIIYITMIVLTMIGVWVR